MPVSTTGQRSLCFVLYSLLSPCLNFYLNYVMYSCCRVICIEDSMKENVWVKVFEEFLNNIFCTEDNLNMWTHIANYIYLLTFQRWGHFCSLNAFYRTLHPNYKKPGILCFCSTFENSIVHYSLTSSKISLFLLHLLFWWYKFTTCDVSQFSCL